MTLYGTEAPPQRRIPSALARRSVAALLAAALVILSPGLAPYEAVAAEFQGRGPVAPSGVPSLSLPQAPVLPGSAIPGLNGPALSIPSLPASAVTMPAAAALPQAAASFNSPLVPGAKVPAAAPAAVPNASGVQAPTTEGLLREGAGRIAAGQQASNDSAVGGALESLFTGGKSAASFGDAPVAGGAGAAAAPLAPLPLEALKTIAKDAKQPEAERRAAVKAIADRSGDAAKLALEEVGTERGGGAADYEIKRLALRRLAEQGKLVSLPPVSDEHAAEILGQIAAQKPQAAAFDYDGTLEPSGNPATAETGAALKALAESGVETMILTDRSPMGRRAGDAGILDALSTLSADQRAAISVGANRGARVIAFDRAGLPLTVRQAAGWTEAEKTILNAAGQRVAAAHGSSLVDGSATLMTDYDFALFLPAGATDEDASRAAQRMREELSALKLQASVVPRHSNPELPSPYVTVTKYDKAQGIAKFLALREVLGRLRDAERLPSFMRGAARAILGRLPSAAVAGSSTLVVGDHFFGERGIDSGMSLGAPGSLGIAVGGSADPRLDNVFVWNKQGHAASMELARAATAPAPAQMEGMNWKAFGGLFGARTFSIIAFLGTTLAYAKIAIGAVGPTSYGTLAALGGLVSIAAGPLMGKLADKFSARTGMAVNTILRAVFLLDLPLFSAFGVLNFWTLLLGAIANGWLLASIMTTEGAYLRRLFGFKNLRTVNSLLQLNYFGLQIVFGLILGIGQLVDGHNLMIPFYIASAVNAFIVLPITWKTMPAAAPQAAPAVAGAPAAPKTSKSRAIAAFFKTYWKETLLLGIGLATFPLLHSALPITAALVYWITRTEGFKALKGDKSLVGAIGLVSLGAFLFYALQSFALPTIATVLVGKAASSLMLGKLLGAVFLGQMISSSSMAKLPTIRLPVIGRFGLQRLVQGAVLAMVGAWVFTGLFPGSLLAAAAFIGAAAAMMAGAHFLTDKGWIKLIGTGLAFLALPALFWGNVPILLGSLAVFGYFFGPASVALSSYIQRRAAPEKIGQVMGIQGSLFNAAISLGIGTVSLIASHLTPMFPGTMWAIAGLAAAAAVVYFLASQKLPGLPARSVHTKEEGKK